MNIFSIGPFEQFNVPRNPDDPYVPIDPPDDEGNPFEWIYDHTQRDKQGDPIKIGPWNDRLTDIVNWIPGALRDTELTELVAIIQDFLNKRMYTTPCKWDESVLETSMLKKIEKILDFRDPSEIDETYIQNYNDLLGFSSTSLNLISNMSGDEPEEGDNVYNRCRELIRSIPYLDANKTTETAMMLLIGLLGQTFEFRVMYLDKGKTGSDYDNCHWDTKGNPTPHFGLVMPIGEGLSDDVSKAVTEIIESIRPINTVYEGITQDENLEVSLGSNTNDGEWKNEPTMRISSTIYNNQFMTTTDAPVFEIEDTPVNNAKGAKKGKTVELKEELKEEPKEEPKEELKLDNEMLLKDNDE